MYGFHCQITCQLRIFSRRRWWIWALFCLWGILVFDVRNHAVYLWKQAPLLRLLPPFIGGILLYWSAHAGILAAARIACMGFTGCLLYVCLPARRQYFFRWLMGISVYALLVATGITAGFYRNNLNNTTHYSRFQPRHAFLVVSVADYPTERPQSFKALVEVKQIILGNCGIRSTGQILLYLRKDSLAAKVSYGDRLLLRADLQPIGSSNNPAGFDYQRYCRLNGIIHQCFAGPANYCVLPGKERETLQVVLHSIQESVLSVLRQHIRGDTEQGLAEALLLGYKQDLDKDLLQVYANTGIVHIIAISGMHLGLIYWILSQLVRPLRRIKKLSWSAPVLILAGLWLFALLTGAGPSILRSAIMFSCIVVGERLSRRSVIYNSLAAAAFLLLCWQPAWLWDAGFQLSFTAVLSILVFAKPVYNCWYIRNNAANYIWKMLSVTLAAQVLTTPVSIFHFHQFPVYFLIANLVAIPLSTLVIFLEIFLCLLAPFPRIAALTGLATEWLIKLMNLFAAAVARLPYAVWDGLQISFVQLLFLYLLITAISCYLLARIRQAVWPALLCVLLFFVLRDQSFSDSYRNRLLVVYNIPGQSLVDFISGRHCVAVGSPLHPAAQRSRSFFRVMVTDSLPSLARNGPCYQFYGRRVVVLDSLSGLPAAAAADETALIILTHNTKLGLSELSAAFRCTHFVADGSNQRGRVRKWEKEARGAGLNCYYVGDKGAFVMNFN